MGPIRVASTHALPVGVVRWADDRALSVVLKATFSLARNGAVAFAAEQMPISIERVGTKRVPGGLDYPSDFVPFKPDADVLLVGHARQPAPAASLPVRIQVGKWTRLMVASTASPVPELTLSPAWLRDGSTGEEAIAGPSALSAPSDTTPEWFEPGFDFGQFNSASYEQLIPWVPPAAKVVVDGVFRDGQRRTVTLPRVRPHAAVVSLEDGIVDVQPMAADTLWIDGDAEICVLVWRSVHHFSRPLESTPRIVAVEDSLDSLDDYVSMARDAPTGRIAAELSHFSTDPAAALGVPIAPPLRPAATQPQPAFEEWETQVVAAPAAAPPVDLPELVRSSTMELEALPAPSALPFAEATQDDLLVTTSQIRSDAEEVTSVGVPLPTPLTKEASRTAGLPFVEHPPGDLRQTLAFVPHRKIPPEGGLPFVPAPPAVSDDTHDTADGDARPGVEGVLPFSDSGPPKPIPEVPPARASSGTITDIINLDELALPSDDGIPTPKVAELLAQRKGGLGGTSVKAALGTMRLGVEAEPPEEEDAPAVVPPPEIVPPPVIPRAAVGPAPPALGGSAANATLVSAQNPVVPETVGQGASIGGAKVATSESPAVGDGDEPARPTREAPVLTIEKYADLKAELWQGKVSRGQVLDKYDLSEIDWKAEDEHWRGRLSEESKRGEAELVRIVTTALMKRR